MGLIYKITNKLNNQSYIGKTSRTLSLRLVEHKKEALEPNNRPFYNAINKYGWDTFQIELLEDNIPNSQLNEKEQYYISLYNTYYNGYNATFGGDGGKTFSKLTEQNIIDIINILTDVNNIQSFNEIGNVFNIDGSIISRINSGESWRQENLIYPLRKYSVIGLTIPKNVYLLIIKDIQESNLSLQEISKKYNLSENQITAINQGHHCYSNHLYYKGLYNGTFPIRKVNNKISIEENFPNILYDILFTKLSMEKIGEKYNITGNTLNYIASGKRRKELTSNFITPLRKNLLQNQQIYDQLYKEGD